MATKLFDTPSMEKWNVFSLWIWVDWWLLQLIECHRSKAVWLPGLDRRQLIVGWSLHMWYWSHCVRSSAIWRLPAGTHAMRRGSLSSSRSRHQTCEWMSLQMIPALSQESPSLHVFPAETLLGHDGTETDHTFCVCLNSWSTESQNGCFKLLSFGVFCYIPIVTRTDAKR